MAALLGSHNVVSAPGRATFAGTNHSREASVVLQGLTLPGAASLVEQLDKRLLVVLRDGRHLVGVMRSFDQFSNMVRGCGMKVPEGQVGLTPALVRRSWRIPSNEKLPTVRGPRF